MDAEKIVAKTRSVLPETDELRIIAAMIEAAIEEKVSPLREEIAELRRRLPSSCNDHLAAAWCDNCRPPTQQIPIRRAGRFARWLFKDGEGA